MPGSAHVAPAILVSIAISWSIPDARNQSAAELRVMREVRSTPARALDPSLPAEAFEAWFGRTAGSNARVEWNISDCGEQTGSPVDSTRDLPVCVSAMAVAGERMITADVLVGTERRGLRERPRLYSAAVVVKGTVWEVRRLGDLATVRDVAFVAAGLPRPEGQSSSLDVAIAACCPGWRFPRLEEVAGRWVPGVVDAGRFIVVGDFNGDSRADVAAILVRSDRTWPLLVIVERHGNGLRTGWTREVKTVDELAPRAPQDVGLMLIRRGAAWGPEGGDVPPAPHPLDSIELSLALTGESRRHRIAWIDGRYVEE